MSSAVDIARTARRAAIKLKTITNDNRTAALKAIHDRLRDNREQILEANREDLSLAERAGISEAMIKRLDLTRPGKFDSMLQGILDVAALDDPTNKIELSRHLDDGLDLYRVTCPIGVLLIIFEARPEVIANISALAIKSGNAAILKGGKESLNTFGVMSALISEALRKTPVPDDSVQLINTRDQVAELLKMDEYIDLVVPRGSNELVRSIKRQSSIPVLGHADGICSIYVDSAADPEMAARIVLDSKTNYPAACNAVETILIHKDAVAAAFPKILNALADAGVTLRLDDVLMEAAATDQLAFDEKKIVRAVPEDFDTEFLSLNLAAKVVSSLEEAVDHINEHGSHHTDCIVTADEATAAKFLRAVDSAGVYWNASTRLADGFRYGFGAEVGVSTNKLHARGPVGLEGIVTYQYVIKGHGQVVGDYIGGGGSRPFKHSDF